VGLQGEFCLHQGKGACSSATENVMTGQGLLEWRMRCSGLLYVVKLVLEQIQSTYTIRHPTWRGQRISHRRRDFRDRFYGALAGRKALYWNGKFIILVMSSVRNCLLARYKQSLPFNFTVPHGFRKRSCLFGIPKPNHHCLRNKALEGGGRG